jgi:hypothetical protein
MAYNPNGLSLVSQRVGAAVGSVWVYASTDPIGVTLAANYFAGAKHYGVQEGEPVTIIDTTNGVSAQAYFSAVGAAHATASINRIQTLTETDPVDPGVQILNLAHNSVVIAATLADTRAHAGKLFIIRNTSASGTAAHTVTITTGTFDGTNKVATLNAPGEQLVVQFDDAGNGVIVQNTGSVGLS